MWLWQAIYLSFSHVYKMSEISAHLIGLLWRFNELSMESAYSNAISLYYQVTQFVFIEEEEMSGGMNHEWIPEGRFPFLDFLIAINTYYLSPFRQASTLRHLLLIFATHIHVSMCEWIYPICIYVINFTSTNYLVKILKNSFFSSWKIRVNSCHSELLI